jgi:hypothetical protein
MGRRVQMYTSQSVARDDVMRDHEGSVWSSACISQLRSVDVVAGSVAVTKSRMAAVEGANGEGSTTPARGR